MRRSVQYLILSFVFFLLSIILFYSWTFEKETYEMLQKGGYIISRMPGQSVIYFLLYGTAITAGLGFLCLVLAYLESVKETKSL